MRQNIFSAMIQTGASLGIAFLSIAIFRFLSPDQIAFLRQHYFVPFALIASFSPANQNYLRSILFSNAPINDLRRDITSLAIVQFFTGIVLLVVTLQSIVYSGTDVSFLNAIAIIFALLVVLVRTIVTGALEYQGNYSLSIIINNVSSAIPYFAAFSLIIFAETNDLFTSSIVLNIICIAAMVFFAATTSNFNIIAPEIVRQGKFHFNFSRYFSLSLISIGSAIVYQGVEFCLYNYTSYEHASIANYALAFSISAIMRQIILTAVQPLEREHSVGTSVWMPVLGQIRRPVAVELIVYIIIVGAVATLPTILSVAFPNFEQSASFIPPLLLGVLGSAIQQVYSVRMIALARTSFLGRTQVALALCCVLAVLILSTSISLVHMIWLTSALVWIRGCLVIPMYAELHDGQHSTLIWLMRALLSAMLLCYVM